MGFNEAHLFAQHMNSLHSLPVFGPEYQPKEDTAETAFNGVLQTYKIVNNTADRDLESFMLNQRSAIVTLIEQRLSQGPQNVQFAVNVQLLKLHQDENATETEERIEIYANSLIAPIYVDGLTNELYWSMVEKLMAVWSTFASSGIDWVVEKKSNSTSNLPATDQFAAHPILPYPISSQTVAEYSIFETTTMPIGSIIASWQRIMRIMELVLIEMTGTIILTKHPQHHFNKGKFTNLWSNLKCQWDSSK